MRYAPNLAIGKQKNTQDNLPSMTTKGICDPSGSSIFHSLLTFFYMLLNISKICQLPFNAIKFQISLFATTARGPEGHWGLGGQEKGNPYIQGGQGCHTS